MDGEAAWEEEAAVDLEDAASSSPEDEDDINAFKLDAAHHSCVGCQNKFVSQSRRASKDMLNCRFESAL